MPLRAVADRLARLTVARSTGTASDRVSGKRLGLRFGPRDAVPATWLTVRKQEKPRECEAFSDGSDGARTRDLRIDSPVL